MLHLAGVRGFRSGRARLGLGCGRAAPHEETTGYDAAFALGRNSRFLQPSTPGMNEAVNGEELATIRAFCALRGQLAVGKPPLVAMLLNQKRTGERLWNLLHLNHITVAGHPYILGTYRVLAGVPMPGLIKDALTSEAVLHHDEARAGARGGTESERERVGSLHVPGPHRYECIHVGRSRGDTIHGVLDCMLSTSCTSFADISQRSQASRGKQEFMCMHRRLGLPNCD